MKLPHECQSLQDVRAGIDQLDARIITALGERLQYVKAASAFKKDEKSIPAPERVAAMLRQRRVWAREAGLDEDFVEQTFQTLINWFINEQIVFYRTKRQAEFAPPQALDRLRLMELLAAAQARARTLGRPVLVSLTQPIPAPDMIAVFEAARGCSEQSLLWMAADAEFSIVSVGAAQLISAQGEPRFERAKLAWDHLLQHALIENPLGETGGGPMLAGGFSFDPARDKTPLWSGFDDASLALPRLQLTQSTGAAGLTLNIVLRAEDDPLAEVAGLEQLWQQLMNRYQQASLRSDTANAVHQTVDLLPAEQWKALVSAATKTIRAGALTKVVLAREVRALSRQPFVVSHALDRLRAVHPGAYLFAVARGARCFFGATPERLVRLASREVAVTALAGTSQRSIQESEDLRLGEQLMNSSKDRHEHALVVEMLRKVLGTFCDDLQIPLEPSLLKLKNLQHLYTPIRGSLKGRATLLDLVAALHPTPAVGGLPRVTAMAYLREHEQLDRGWYAAPIGWMDARGNGEFAVALRSALALGNEATLFAGCGIVGDSDPEHEFQETCLKLRAMLFALGVNERRSQ